MAITRGYAAAARTAGDRSLAGLFRQGMLLLFALYLGGLALGVAFERFDGGLSGFPDRTMTMALFHQQDTLWFGLGLLLIGYLGWMMYRPTPVAVARTMGRYWPREPRPFRHAAVMALIVLVIAAAGTLLLHRGLGPSVGDQAAAFQALIFRQGRLLAPVPEEWAGYATALLPVSGFHDPASGLWGSGQPPVLAALRALLSLAWLGPLTNAILSALSVLLIAAAARRLWPERKDTPIVAAALLITSPQFLITGMTGVAWSAHLCLNLLWLWCYLRDDRTGHALAALVGVAAVGLHQMHVHGLFVLPFMLALVRDRRRYLAAFYVVVYAAGHLIWLFWHEIAVLLTLETLAGQDGQDGGIGGLFSGPPWHDRVNLAGPVLLGPGLLRLVAWLNLIMVPLVFVALRFWSGLPPVLRLLAWSCLSSTVPYLLLMPDQMVGWGYGGLHGLLGNMALLAAYGWIRLSDDKPAVQAAVRRAVGASVAIMLLVALPVRAVQVGSIVGSNAEAVSHIRAMTSEVVLIDHPGIRFGTDLVRNDPFLRNRPKVMALQALTSTQLATLCDRYSVAVVDYHDLAVFGVRPATGDPAGHFDIAGDDRALRAIATGPRCRPD